MQSKSYPFVLSLLAAMLAILFSFSGQAQLANVGPVTVISDKDDYAPRSNAVFTGTGFLPGEDVILKVKNLSRPCNTVTADSSYLPWTVKADGSGNFVTNWTVCDCVGDSLRLKVAGQTSGYIAYAYFTDGNVNNVTISPKATSSNEVVYRSGNAAVYSATVNLNANSNPTQVYFYINNLPTGATYSPTSFLVAENVGSATVDISITPSTSTQVQTLTNIEFIASNNANKAVNSDPKQNITLKIIKATPQITWSNPSNITYGQALGNTQLNASANVAGAFTYTPASDTRLNAGNEQPLSVVFTPTDAANYNTASTIVKINVEQASLNVKANDKTRVYNIVNPTLDGTLSGVIAGDGITASYITSALQSSNVGDYPITVTLNDPNSKLSNYDVTNTSGKLTITPADATINISDLEKTYSGSAQGPTVTTTPSGIAVIVTYNGEASVPTNAGTYNVIATLNNSNYVAENTSATLKIAKVNQAITVTQGAPSSAAYNSSFTVAATSSSGFPVSYTSTTPLTNTNESFTMTSGIGKGTVRYNQAGDNNYNPATEVVEEVEAQKASQTISFEALANKTFGDAPFTISATASSNLAIIYSIVSGPATTSGNTITMTGAGTVVVKASQAGDDNYSAAADQTQSFDVAKAEQTITFNELSDKKYGDAPFAISASASTGLPVSLSVSGPASYDETSGMLTINGAGAVTVTASQAGNSNYLAATEVVQSFEVEKGEAAIVVNGYNAPYDGAAHGASLVSVTGAKGETLSAALVDLGATYTDVPGGLANWSFAGDANHKPSTGSVAITISKASNTINFSALTTKTYGNSDFTLNATSSSGLPVSYTASGNATVSGNTVHITGAGSATITAHQAGNNNYEAATNISQSFAINKANAIINVSGYTNTYDGIAHGASGTAIGVFDEDLTNLLNLGDSYTDYPGGRAGWSFAGNENYNEANGEVQIQINKATSTTIITISGAPFTYNGAAIMPAAVSVTGAGGLSLTPTATYQNNTNAGTAMVSYTFAGDDNHLGSSDSKTFVIGKANATVTVTPYNVTYDGNEHMATGSASGVKGEVLSGLDLSNTKHTNTGAYTTDIWSFTDITGNYQDVAATLISNNITKAYPVIEVQGYNGIYNGNAHGATGTATGVKGEDLSNLLNMGVTFTDYPGGTANWSFTGNTNYEATSGTAAIVINKAKPVITLIYGNAVNYDGQPHYVTSANVTGVGSPAQNLGNAVLVYKQGTTTVAHPINAGVYDVTASFAGNTNYEVADVKTGILTINKVPLIVTVKDANKYVGQINPGFDVLYDGFVNGETETVLNGTLSYPTAAYIYSCPGQYEVNASGLTAVNYDISYNKGTLTIEGVTVDASASGNPVPYGSSVKLYATVTSAGKPIAGVRVTFKLDTDEKGYAITGDGTNGTTLGIASLTIPTSLSVNVYQVTASAGTECKISSLSYLPIYDPNAGFVTGGGWINSPAGAYVADPTATGKANFGFVAKYKKGSTTLDGETEFQFQAGNLNFKSTSYEAATLVIGGYKASYRGVGTINGTGSYKFTLSAVDGQLTGGGGADRVRMKITDLAGNTVYDNQAGADNADLTQASTILGGGSIVIHEVKAGKQTAQLARTQEMEIGATVEFGLKAFPNPTTSKSNIKLESNNYTDPITLLISDQSGRVVRLIPGLTAGQTIQLGSEYKPGVYFIEMIQGSNHKQLKLLKQPN
jgi:hypothetical protein